jgi:hypothetical protein
MRIGCFLQFPCYSIARRAFESALRMGGLYKVALVDTFDIINGKNESLLTDELFSYSFLATRISGFSGSTRTYSRSDLAA